MMQAIQEMAQVKMDHKEAKRRTKMSEDVISGSASSEWEQMNMNPGQQRAGQLSLPLARALDWQASRYSESLEA